MSAPETARIEIAKRAHELFQLGNFLDALLNFETLLSLSEKEIGSLNEDVRRQGAVSPPKLMAINEALDVNAYMHAMAGHCSIRLHDYGNAIEHFTQAIMNKPEHDYLVEEHGKARVVRLEHPEAILPFGVGGRKLVNLSGLKFGDSVFMRSLGNVVRFRNDVAHFATCYLWLGKAYMMGPKLFLNSIQALQAACRYLENVYPEQKTADLRKSLGPCLFDLGMCHYYLQKYREALGFFERALRIYSDQEKNTVRPENYDVGMADCLLWIGECYLQTEDFDAALERLQKSLRLSQELRIEDNIKRSNELISSAMRMSTMKMSKR